MAARDRNLGSSRQRRRDKTLASGRFRREKKSVLVAPISPENFASPSPRAWRPPVAERKRADIKSASDESRLTTAALRFSRTPVRAVMSSISFLVVAVWLFLVFGGSRARDVGGNLTVEYGKREFFCASK